MSDLVAAALRGIVADFNASPVSVSTLDEFRSQVLLLADVLDEQRVIRIQETVTERPLVLVSSTLDERD